MNKKYKKLLKNTGLLTIGNFASRILGMLLIPFYTAILSPQDYGISDLIVTTTSLLFPFTTIAISEAIMRFSLDKNTDKKTIYSMGISIVLVGYVLILLISPIIKMTVLSDYYVFFLLYYITYCLHTITSYFVKGLEKIKIFSFTGLLNTVIIISCNLIFLLVLKLGIIGYLLSSIIGHFFCFIFMFLSAKLYKYIVLPFKFDFVLIKKMILYSLPIIPNSLSWWIANSSDKYILKYFSDISNVGIYSVAYKIPTLIMTIMGLFISAWQLSAVEDFGTQKSKNFFSDVYKKYFAIIFCLASVLIIFSKIMAYMLFSDEFFVAYKYIPILLFACSFDALSSFMGTVYIAAKKTKMLAISTIIGAATNIILNFILIPKFDILGAAVATALSYFVIWIVRIIDTRRVLSFQINYKRDILLISVLILEIAFVMIDRKMFYVFTVIVFSASLIPLIYEFRSLLKSITINIIRIFRR